MSKEKRRDSGFKFLAIFVGFLVVGSVIAGIVVMMLGLNFWNPLEMNLDLFWIGIYILFGASGLAILGLPAVMCGWLNKRRGIIAETMKTVEKNIKDIPYPTFSQALKAKRRDYCEYCGFEVYSKERECPECGGPIKRGLS